MQPASRKTSASLFRAYDSVRQPQCGVKHIEATDGGPKRAEWTGKVTREHSHYLDLKFCTRT